MSKAWLFTIHLNCGTKLYAKVTPSRYAENGFTSAWQRWENAIYRAGQPIRSWSHETNRYTTKPAPDPPKMPNKGNGVSDFAIEDGDWPTREEWEDKKFVIYEPIG